MRFNLVYGNHGASPNHIEDLLRYIQCQLTALGHFVEYNPFLVRDACNIVVESFTKEVSDVLVASRKEGVDFITVVTEIITNTTFNDHSDPSKPRDTVSEEWYTNRAMWQQRFDAYLRVADVSRAIWCIADFQLESYRGTTNARKVHLIPLEYIERYVTVRHQTDELKNIDILFTGTLSSRRTTILNSLRAAGKVVFDSSAATPAFIRDDFIARSKICVNLAQTDDWRYPSIMRFFYHVMNSSYLLSESVDIPDRMSSFVDICDRKSFVNVCLAILNERQYSIRANEKRTLFQSASVGSTRFSELLDLTFATQNGLGTR